MGRYASLYAEYIMSNLSTITDVWMNIEVLNLLAVQAFHGEITGAWEEKPKSANKNAQSKILGLLNRSSSDASSNASYAGGVRFAAHSSSQSEVDLANGSN